GRAAVAAGRLAPTNRAAQPRAVPAREERRRAPRHRTRALRLARPQPAGARPALVCRARAAQAAPPRRRRSGPGRRGDPAGGVAQGRSRPVMWLVPHFLALDVAGAAVQLNIARPGASIYQTQTDAVVDAAMRQGRLRFNNAKIFSRDQTARPLMRAIREGAGF